MVALVEKTKRTAGGRRQLAFSEMEVWRPFGRGWRKLQGGFRSAGYSIEWHDFSANDKLDWAKSFHPGSLEICLNLAGHAEIQAADETMELGPLTAGFYAQHEA